MESVGESEKFWASKIGIGVPLVVWIYLKSEGIRDLNKEEWLVIWSMALESITQMLELA